MDESKIHAHMISNYLPCTKEINLDGNIHRYCKDESKKEDEWYVGSVISEKAFYCSYGSWSGGTSYTYRSWEADIEISPEDLKGYKERIEESKKKWEEELRENRESLKEFIAKLNKTTIHTYLRNKQIDYSCKMFRDQIIIPIYDINTKELISVQRIFTDGEKRFGTGLSTKNGHYPFGTFNKNAPLYLAEGFATGYSLHKSLNAPVCVCFSASAIPKIAKELQKQGFTNLIHCQDLGEAGENATLQTKELGIKSVTPRFEPGDTGDDFNDFNDFLIAYGEERLRELFKMPEISVCLVDIDEMNLPAEKYIIKDFLYEGSVALVWSGPGVGKTMFLYCLAFHASMGIPFLWINIDKPVKICYIDGEQSLKQIKHRIFPVIKTGAKPPVQNYDKTNFKVLTHDLIYNYMGEPVDLLQQKQLNFIDAQLDAQNPDIIVLDNYSALFETEGLDHQSKELAWKKCRQWTNSQKRENRTVVLVHHDTKDGEKFAGLAQMNRFVDMEICMKKINKEDPRINFNFIYKKNRLNPEFCIPRSVYFNTIQTPSQSAGWNFEAKKI